MNQRLSSMLLAALLTVACAKKNAERDSQIGRTTYDGSEAMQPASGTDAPNATPPSTESPELEVPAASLTAQASEEAGTTGSASTESPNASAAEPKRTPDVIYVPTPQPIVDKMLELARVKKDDLVYDLGCGDGRIVVTAAKRYGARAVGFDIDPQRVKEAQQNVKKNKVEHLVTIEEKDIFKLDLTPASVVTLYLLPTLNNRLVPQLERLAAGSRVVSHNYDISGVTPAKSLEMTPRGESEAHSIFFYTMPFQRDRGLPLGRQTVPPPTVP